MLGDVLDDVGLARELRWRTPRPENTSCAQYRRTAATSRLSMSCENRSRTLLLCAQVDRQMRAVVDPSASAS